MTAILAALGGILAAGILVAWGIQKAQRGGEKKGRLSAQAEALAEGQKRAERARRKANQPLTGDPKVVARRMRERLARRRRELQFDDIELPPDSGPTSS